jgi:hypothetical protein
MTDRLKDLLENAICEVRAVWDELKFLLAAATLSYILLAIAAAGYNHLVGNHSVHPLLGGLIAAVFASFFIGTFENWMKKDHKYGYGLVYLSVIVFFPIVCAWLSGRSGQPLVAEWALWLKFRVSAVLLAIMAAAAYFEWMERREESWYRKHGQGSSESQADGAPPLAAA